MSKFQNDAIFWVDVDKIDPNPYQPRRDFNEEGLRDLAESIRQYGVLQPLTVTRNEETKDDGGLKVYYELIAGERRLRAAKMANLSQVPVTIRDEKEDAEVKLELAIIENLQREDLNPVERAEAFNQLSEEFDFTHKEIAEKIGKSREYVSNSMRLLKLPEEIKQAVIAGKITEGHARPIMMLRDKPEKQQQLFKEVVRKDLTVRETEERARRDAQDKVRKEKNKVDPETKALEEELSDTLGTRVTIEKDNEGGKLVIDFFSDEDLEGLIKMVKNNEDASMDEVMKEYADAINEQEEEVAAQTEDLEEKDGKSEKKDLESREQSENTKEDTKQQTQTASSDSGETASERVEENQQSQSMAETLGSMIQQARAEQNNADDDNESNESEESHTQTSDSEETEAVTEVEQSSNKDRKEAGEASENELHESDKLSEKPIGTSKGTKKADPDSSQNMDNDQEKEAPSATLSNANNNPNSQKELEEIDDKSQGSQSKNDQQDSPAKSEKEDAAMEIQGNQDANTSQPAEETKGQHQSKGNEPATNNTFNEAGLASAQKSTTQNVPESSQQQDGAEQEKPQTDESEQSGDDTDSSTENKDKADDTENISPSEDGSQEEDDEDDMYSVSNFSI